MTGDHDDEAPPDLGLASQDTEEGKQERERLRQMAWDMQQRNEGQTSGEPMNETTLRHSGIRREDHES